MTYRLQDLIDIGQFQLLQDRLNEIYSFPSAIIDNDGNVLTATGWQDICTKFHRANKSSAAECVKSDRYILSHLPEANPAVSYLCPHGLIDNATPIIIEGVHYGNFFTGQFFLEKPDLAFFRSQAKVYGFDEAAYLEAVRKVPIWTREQLNHYLFFIKGLIEVISGIGLKNLRETEARSRVKESEEQTRKSQTMLAGILNSVPQSIFWKDRDGAYLGCNENFARAVGMTDAGQIVGKTDYDLPWPRAEADAYRADDRAVIDRNEPKRHIVEPLQAADGNRIWIETTKVPLRSSSGSPYGILGVYEDITERKLAGERLQARERQLAESQRIAHIGSWEHNLATGQVFWSDELFRILGLDPAKDKADFQMFFDMIHPDDRTTLKEAIERTVRLRTPFSIDYRFVLRDGRTRIIHAQAELISDDSGTQPILSGTGQDLTERIEAEQRLRRSEEFIRSVLDTVDEGFIVVDRDYRIRTANKAYCRQVGGGGEEVVGAHCYEASHRTLRPCFEEGEECPVRQVFETGEPAAALHRHQDRDGHILFVETKAYPVKDDAGEVTSAIETVNNITEKHLLEEEQLKTQKLESIGTLAGGIAHDFNNLLQGVFGYISMAKRTLDQKETSLNMLEQAEKALHISVNLTTQLLTFSKGGTPVRKRIAVRPVIENAAKFALSGSRVDCRVFSESSPWMIDADEGQISQVIQNLVLNADQAMPMGGTIAISVTNVSGGGAVPGLPKGDHVEIAVQDSGLGIPESHLPKVFDPYFTTKDKGSGLGLATSYSIVRNHGGMITVKSELGKGATFLVYLPAAAGKETPAPDAAPAGTAVRKARILVMDDEDIIRDVAEAMLAALGHDVASARDGSEALEKYRRSLASGPKFDIVVLDLTIRGGMGGQETMQRLLELDPDVKAIVSSGYADSAAISEYQAMGFKACLKKPYDLNLLNLTLNGLLA